jgi:type IV pilus assembly protein PilM
VIAQEVLTQYEELLIRAGFAPCLIDFHALTLYSAYRSIVDLGAEFFLIGVDNHQLSILTFENKLLDFYRIKGVVNTPEQIFQEINRSMVGYRRSHAAISRSTVYLHTDWPQRDELCEAVRSALDHEIQILPSPLSRLSGSGKLAISTAEANGMAVALGMAERMIQRVN